MPQISPQDALIHLMVTMSAADRLMSDHELAKIGNIVRMLPAFDGFDPDTLVQVTRECTRLLQQEEGLNTIIDNAFEALPRHLHETAYAIAVEVAAADLEVSQEELRLLELLRSRLQIDRLSAAAIERGARARHQRL